MTIKFRDLLLDALTASSGTIDAISYFALGKVFCAFMTGNIVFVGLGVADIGAAGGVALTVALLGFAVGVFISAQIVSAFEESAIWSQRVTIALSICLIPQLGFLGLWFATQGRPSLDVAHVLLALWAFAMGMQSSAVRHLRVEGVFTTAATATMILFVEALTHWSKSVVAGLRLGRVLLSLFVGAIAGGLLLVRARLYAPLLPFVITLFVVVTSAILFRGHDTRNS